MASEKSQEEPQLKRIKGENGAQIDTQAEANDESRNESMSNMDEAGDSLTQLILLLDWSSRDRVMLSMNRFTSELYSESCPIERRKELIKENHALIRLLMTLPVQSKGNKFKYVIDLTADEATGGQKKEFGPKLKLQWSLRHIICDCLFQNHHTVMYFDDADEQTKKTLIEMNVSLVQKLMSLEVAKEVDLTPKVKQGEFLFQTVNRITRRLGSNLIDHLHPVHRTTGIVADERPDVGG